MAGETQKISREGALRAVTLDAAYSLKIEKEIGSIATGKLANFTILGENPVTCDPMVVKDISVWGTVHEGRLLPVNRTSTDDVSNQSTHRDRDTKELDRIRRLNAESLRRIESNDRSILGLLSQPAIKETSRGCTCGSPLVHALVAAFGKS